MPCESIWKVEAAECPDGLDTTRAARKRRQELPQDLGPELKDGEAVACEQEASGLGEKLGNASGEACCTCTSVLVLNRQSDLSQDLERGWKVVRGTWSCWLCLPAMWHEAA